jgi:hypothetical protein
MITIDSAERLLRQAILRQMATRAIATKERVKPKNIKRGGPQGNASVGPPKIDLGEPVDP